MMMTTELQAATVAYLRKAATDGVTSALTKQEAWAILAALPEEVTNPKPELPTEPGLYLDKDGDVWRVWDSPKDGMDRLADPAYGPNGNITAHEYAPFTRLVPEKPPMTAGALSERYYEADGEGEGWDAIADYVNGPRA